MLRTLLIFALPCALGGCATGYVTDWWRDRTSIITPQLIRYGFTVDQSRCVSSQMGRRLSRQELRQFQENAAALQPARPDARLTLANLRAVASGLEDREVRGELDLAVRDCAVPPTASVAAGPAVQGRSPETVAPESLASGRVPVDMSRGGSMTPATWLNLGSAESGQSIAIDAMSIQQEGPSRSAWFRMSDPESRTPTSYSYHMRIDCAAKTVQPLALRQTGPDGVELSLRRYTPEEVQPGPAESGTVLEIAYLSLCT
jgi:hypothetical protein